MLQVPKRALSEKPKSEKNETLKQLLHYEIRKYPPSLAELTTDIKAIRIELAINLFCWI